MSVLSVLRNIQATVVPAFRSLQNSPQSRKLTTGITRLAGGGGHAHFGIAPSRYQWNKYKDSLHFYILLGAIPCLTVVFLTNVFIGPAKLAEIPDDYEPEYWEYYQHPISRFIARYIVTSYQEDYERNLFYMKEESEMIRIRLLRKKADLLMVERGDYRHGDNESIMIGKYIRHSHEENEYIRSTQGNM